MDSSIVPAQINVTSRMPDFLYSAASYGGKGMDTSVEQARKLRNLAQASLRFGCECDKVRGRKHWALDAKLRAWKLERDAAALESSQRD